MPFIDEIVRRQQYEQEDFSIDCEFAEGEIPVAQGDIIGYSGNSGSSGGPHLHLDIRDTDTQDPMDPQEWLSSLITDDVAPEVRKLVFYTHEGVMGNTARRTERKAVRASAGSYSIGESAVSYTHLPVFTVRQGVVIAVYPGATSDEVEEQVTKPLEDFIFEFKEVKKSKTHSLSRDGMAIVFVELNDAITDKDEFWAKFKHRAAVFKSELPTGVLALVTNDDFGDTSAMLITIESTMCIRDSGETDCIGWSFVGEWCHYFFWFSCR